MDQNQRRMVLRQILASPVAREAMIGGLQAERETAIEGVVQQVDPALIHRAQGRVQMLDDLIKEYTVCLAP